MFFINYSQNLLFITLALCALCLTIVITIFFYHLILAARDLRATASLAKKQLVEIKELVDNLKSGFGIAGLLVTTIKEAACSAKDFFANYSSKKSSKKRNL